MAHRVSARPCSHTQLTPKNSQCSRHHWPTALTTGIWLQVARPSAPRRCSRHWRQMSRCVMGECIELLIEIEFETNTIRVRSLLAWLMIDAVSPFIFLVSTWYDQTRHHLCRRSMAILLLLLCIHFHYSLNELLHVDDTPLLLLQHLHHP